VVTSQPASHADSVLVRACRRQPVPYTPIWFMRQAGRSLPEYRKVRAGISMLESCLRPDLVIEITLQPVRRYGVDAAILYSDIVLPLKAIGLELDIVPGVGPVVERPVRSSADVQRLRQLEPSDVAFITESITGLIDELGSTPLIGFAGAPFTLASYLVEGGPSKHHERTKVLMRSEPQLWQTLLDRLADISVAYLRTQVEAGASAVQLFDSWAGALSAADYARYVWPHSARLLAAVGELGVPRLHFGVGTGEFLHLLGSAGADVVGVDWRVPLDEACRRIGAERAVQGNLDPAILGAPWPVVVDEVRRVLAEGRAAAGHIFNLGHGVLPSTDPAVLERVVELVHEESQTTT
jgi:uroporphyrinogen decarboxylase